jgi:hypothetical protein
LLTKKDKVMASDPAKYDAGIIQEFADRLYGQAASIIFTSALLGVVTGATISVIVVIAAQVRQALGTVAIVGALLGGLIGYARGRERAFRLKLEAQVALCQIQIEKNTRS